MTNVLERYHNDPHFHALVDSMYLHIEHADFTPTEIREAAMVAMMLYEDYHPRPIYLDTKDGSMRFAPRPWEKE